MASTITPEGIKFGPSQGGSITTLQSYSGFKCFSLSSQPPRLDGNLNKNYIVRSNKSIFSTLQSHKAVLKLVERSSSIFSCFMPSSSISLLASNSCSKAKPLRAQTSSPLILLFFVLFLPHNQKKKKYNVSSYHLNVRIEISLCFSICKIYRKLIENVHDYIQRA